MYVLKCMYARCSADWLCANSPRSRRRSLRRRRTRLPPLRLRYHYAFCHWFLLSQFSLFYFVPLLSFLFSSFFFLSFFLFFLLSFLSFCSFSLFLSLFFLSLLFLSFSSFIFLSLSPLSFSLSPLSFFLGYFLPVLSCVLRFARVSVHAEFKCLFSSPCFGCLLFHFIFPWSTSRINENENQ